ncbi:hypothetical protein BMS3Abin01_00137 [bacterium BMS3Abin01]|nr:hypothetical protein BMS3Abin01_00137 [bacterium BMS3Abin01]
MNRNKQKSTSGNGVNAHLEYQAPRLTRCGNVREVTFECSNWQCSVTVPPPPES